MDRVPETRRELGLPPRPGLWTEEEAIAEYIDRVMVIRLFKDVEQWLMDIRNGTKKLYRPPPTLKDYERAVKDFKAGNYEPMFDLLRSPQGLSTTSASREEFRLLIEAKQLIIAKCKGTFESPRSAGKLKKLPAEREARSIRPQAEDTLFVIYGLLAGLFPDQPDRDVYDRALYLTVSNPCLGYNSLTTEGLDWFIRKASDDRRFGKPKLKLKGHSIAVTSYLDMG